MPLLTSLQLSPPVAIELPYAKLQSASVDLILTSVSEKSVAYKIKTTAPKNYLVRPSTGLINPGGNQLIQIILQPLQTLPETNTDRFLVQAVEVDSADVQVTKEFWSNVPKSILQDHRLSVVFKPVDSLLSPKPPMVASTIAPSAAGAKVDASDARRPASFPPPTTASSDFESKYNDLLQYCLALDKQKTVVANELNEARQNNETLTQRLKQSLCNNCGGQVEPQSRGGENWALWRVIAVIVGAVIISKIFNFL